MMNLLILENQEYGFQSNKTFWYYYKRWRHMTVDYRCHLRLQLKMIFDNQIVESFISAFQLHRLDSYTVKRTEINYLPFFIYMANELKF